MVWVAKSSGRWVAGFILWLLLSAAADAADPKRVLVLLSFGRDFRPWSEYAKDLRIQLNKRSPWPLDIIEYSLVGARSADDPAEAPFIQYLGALFAGRPPDLIIGIGAPAATFVQRNRAELFKKSPLLLTALEARRVQPSLLTENDAVVAVHHDFRVLFENILRVRPDTKNIVVVNGASANERFWKGETIRETESLQGRVTITWTDHLSFEDLLKYAAKLPPNAAIFWYQLLLDSAGVVHEGDTALQRLYAVATAPIFSHDDAFFGEELVGGPMHSVTLGNQRAAVAAVRLLAGEQGTDIKVPPSNFAAPKFDWRALQRWQISESLLPPGSEIFFRQSTIWEQYRWQVFSAFAALLLQCGLITWLVYEHQRRSRAEISSRNAAAELANVNRLATAGQLSASIAHEINQPLTGIVMKGNAGLRWLAAEKPDVNKVRVLLSDIVEAGHHAGNIVTSVRAIFKKDTSTRVLVNLNNLINTVLVLQRQDLQKDEIRVEKQLDEQLPAVMGDRVQIQQVILNLIVNASDAMHAVQPRILKIRTMRLAPGKACVMVEDCGPGIGEVERTRVFDPMFTTKPRGMGMGLSICRSIIEGHGGKIWISSAVGHGAVFQFELPEAANPNLPEVVRANAEDP